MATVAQTPTPSKPQSYYATLYNDELHGILGKVDGRMYFFCDNGDVIDFEPDMMPWTTVLGATSIADTQRIMDRIHGDAAWIATHRDEGRS